MRRSGRWRPIRAQRRSGVVWTGPDSGPATSRLTSAVVVDLIDQAMVLIGSADLTGAAFERNLECGLLIRGGPVPAKISAHVCRLADLGVLRTLT